MWIWRRPAVCSGGLVQDTIPQVDSATTLIGWYRVKGASREMQREAAVDRLRADLAADVATKTGVVHVSVTLRDPILAAGVNRRLLELINEFNLHTRQTQAGAERRFTEQRMAEVRTDMNEAERRLASFLKVNRDYQNAPDLRFQYDRLSREVNIQQQLFVSLAQAFEQAKIDEVRDTPVISVIESRSLRPGLMHAFSPSRCALHFWARRCSHCWCCWVWISWRARRRVSRRTTRNSNASARRWLRHSGPGSPASSACSEAGEGCGRDGNHEARLMCGIAGLVGLPRALAEARVRIALERLRHRGPDGDGLHLSESVVLGMRRLAIIDVDGGQQPIYDESRRIAVICNGEIYNYIELFHELERRGHVLQSRSDINVIPHLYQERGRDMMVPCRGIFAGALWDERIQSLLLVRDRAGKKPLFWSRLRGGIAFASQELPALLALLDRVPCYA